MNFLTAVGRIAAALIGAATRVDVTDTVRSLLPIRQANTGPRNETDTVQTGRLNAGSPSLVQGVADCRDSGGREYGPGALPVLRFARTRWGVLSRLHALGSALCYSPALLHLPKVLNWRKEGRDSDRGRGAGNVAQPSIGAENVATKSTHTRSPDPLGPSRSYALSKSHLSFPQLRGVSERRVSRHHRK